LLEIGVGLTASGGFFMLLGVLMLFDSGLLAIGNVHPPLLVQFCRILSSFLQILFLAGVTLIIGMKKTVNFFFGRPGKLRGTICFLGGIILVFLKWTITGMLIEMFGFLNLFG
jgi:hypothetical protein